MNSLPHCCEKEWRLQKEPDPEPSPADPHTTARGLGSYIRVNTLTLPNCVALGKLLNLSKHHFSHL